MGDFVVVPPAKSGPRGSNRPRLAFHHNQGGNYLLRLNPAAYAALDCPERVQLLSDGNGRVAVRAAVDGVGSVVRPDDRSNGYRLGATALVIAARIVKTGGVPAEMDGDLLVADIRRLQ